MLDFDTFFRSKGVNQSRDEGYNLCKFLQQTSDIEGDVVEVGVYSGGSARLLNRYKPKHKKLYLFDTFAGWMDYSEEDSGGLIVNGGFAFSDYEYVKNVFEGHNVEVIKGYFPDSAPVGFEDKRFSFVHLDVDTYLSTLKSLEYLYDKVNSGGIFMIHDYINNDAPGVRKAVDRFLSNRNEKAVFLIDSQAMVIKT